MGFRLSNRSLNLKMFGGLSRTSRRAIKTMFGQHVERGEVSTLINQRADIGGRMGYKKAKDAYEKRQMKSHTLAYPEDALITEHGAAKAVSGVSEAEGRTVRISQKTRNVMQSADKNAQGWVIQFDPQARWENNTMGWGSPADPLSNVDGWMNFKTKEAAIAFAERQGWEIEIVQEARKKKLEFRQYGDNFHWNKRLRKPAK